MTIVLIIVVVLLLTALVFQALGRIEKGFVPEDMSNEELDQAIQDLQRQREEIKARQRAATAELNERSP